MNREEFVTKVQDLVNQAYLHDVDSKYYEGLMHEAEKWRYPLTLAEFLGWEEEVEYRRGGDIFKVKGNNLFKKGEECSSGWCNFRVPSDELEQLRNAEKIDEPKYYAKIKGWELIENSEFIYWNVDSEEGDVFISTNTSDPRYQASLAKKEWNELGINDKNADFEEIVEV